ncbi:MAG: hypothetical protein ACNI27_03755 [Desulfovibrio sp.]
MATSKVKICNRALAMIGEAARIINLDESSETARLCRLMYEDLLHAVLEEHPWGFAHCRKDLGGPVLPAPAFGFRFAYQVPNDCIKVLEIYDSKGTQIKEEMSWEREGDRLVIDVPNRIFIKYTRKVEDAGLYPPLFVEALVARLSAELSEPLAKQNSLTDRLWGIYNRKIARAKSSSAREQAQKRAVVGTWAGGR